ncbi:DUF2612 domain-containing protein [Candidatus Arsenophonus triatominarum]|uniref:DUF2612 domain-containing protein n=1 Tax=Candidatus Arsenophonus triatominarum TaxID=57911 RepID=UPI003CCBA305
MWGKSSTFHVTSRRKSITARLGLRRQTKEKRIIPPRSVMPLLRGVQETRKIRLADNAYRSLILSKAFSNISIATIPEINRFLRFLFKERGEAFV